MIVNTIHISSFQCGSHLATAIQKSNIKIKNLASKWGLQLKTVIRRGVNSGKVMLQKRDLWENLKDGVTVKR